MRWLTRGRAASLVAWCVLTRMPSRGKAFSGCADPAGASPVPVSAGAPGSRPQARAAIPVSRAGRREPLRRERARGPQHEVNPAASSDEQSGSRADHVAAKATLAARKTGERSAGGPAGVGGAARGQGSERNRRGPGFLRDWIEFRPGGWSGSIPCLRASTTGTPSAPGVSWTRTRTAAATPCSTASNSSGSAAIPGATWWASAMWWRSRTRTVPRPTTSS